MKKAFTLIELAIVLVIIGLLIGGGISIYSILVKRSKVKATENIINDNIQIIKTFTSEHKRLPNSDEFETIVKKNSDIWNKKLSYKYDNNLTDKNAICYERNTSLSIKICKDANCNNVEETINNVAFLILSSGINLNMQTNLDNNEVKIYVQGVKVDDNTSDIDKKEPYDDIVKWVTLNELKEITDCKEEKLHLINNSIPYGYQNQDYNATIFATGGLEFDSNGKYKWCYEGELPPGLNANPNFHSNNCLNDLDFWKNADNFNISGKPQTSGDYKITVYVSDKLQNIDKRSYVITINPSSNSGENSGGGRGGGPWWRWW